MKSCILKSVSNCGATTVGTPGGRSWRARAVRSALLLGIGLCSSFAVLPQPHDAVGVGANSAFGRLVPAQTLERSAQQQYALLLRQARGKSALGSASNVQVKRLRGVAQRLIPFAIAWNERARAWQWEVNLIASQQINAFCMPGGKIAFYTGLIQSLRLSDDEIAIVMGHEMAHALREHARARMAKTELTGLGANLAGQLLGLGAVGQVASNYGAQLLTLKFSRADESEADLVGLELAARAGFDPRAGVGLWQKMAAANRTAPPQWLSTHPAGATRIADLQASMAKVMPLYQRALRSAAAASAPRHTVP